MKYLYFIITLVLLSCSEKDSSFNIDDTYLSNYNSHQADLLEERKSYLQLIGLHKLELEANTFGNDSSNNFVIDIPSLPIKIGSINTLADQVYFVSVDGVNVWNDKDSLISSIRLELNEYGNSVKLHHGRLIWQVITRGGELYLRIWDIDNPAVDNFKGFVHFELNPEFIIEGNFSYYPFPKTGIITTQLGVTETIKFIGNVSFTYNDQPYALDVDEGGFTIVGDATSGIVTYAGGRYIDLDLPKQDSLIVLDFNRLYNPPCTFSEFTTCPLPPSQNVLPFSVLAGEKYQK